MKKLNFIPSQTPSDVQNVVDYDLRTFANQTDFDWSAESIKNLLKGGWELYSAQFEGDIVAAVLVKRESASLLTQNTPIKMNFQGNGFSHQIKDFYEEYAQKMGLERIINHCRADNFRAISLNETHGYKQIDTLDREGNEFLEWEKILKTKNR